MKLIILATLFLLSINLIFISSVNSMKKFRNSKDECNLYKEPMSEAEKKEIVDSHNDVRNKIALQTFDPAHKLPFATNMIQMYYNDELALKAQEWANKCTNKNSVGEDRSNPKYKVGESVWMRETSGGKPKPEWKKAVEEWGKQISSFGKKSLKKFKFGGPQTEAFTQLIWANTYWVGCGFSQYTTPKGTASLHVCQYGPAGNVPGETIYMQSKEKKCNCLKGLTCGNKKYPGLCCPDGFCEELSLKYDGDVIVGTVKIR
jgi:hypothetical protein